MFPALCLFVAIAQADVAKDPPSLYRAVVSKPDSSNGYEYFLLALDSIKDNGYRTLRANVLNDTSKPILAGKQFLINRFSYAIGTVRAGLKKRIFNPQNIVEPTTSFPETAWMVDMTQLFLMEANVRHAAGNPLASTQSYFDAYEFNCAIQRSGPMEPYFAGIEPKNKILIELAAALPKYTLPELAQIEKWAQARLGATDLLDSLGFEKSNIEGQLDNVGSGKWRNRTDRDNALLQQLGSLKFAEGNMARGQIEQDTRHALSLWTDMLKYPERDWVRPQFPQYSKYGEGFVQNINSTIEPSVKALAVERTKLRLFIVAAKLYAYRWNYEKFPAKLTDAMDSNTAIDPLTGQPYTYEPSASGVRLSSLGSRISGPVYLVDAKKE